MKNLSINHALILFFLTLALLPLNNGMLEPDGALYATIAKNMVLNHNRIDLIFQGSDWLDKPHLQFWITALSFKIFGINAFAYKLPSLLVWYAGVYYVYLLARSVALRSSALFSTIIYMSATHILIANFDVRAEAYVTTFSTAALYHLYRVSRTKYSLHILWTSIFAALAIMTKGVFVLFPIMGGFIWYWFINKDFKSFFQVKYWLVFLLTGIGIIPELYSLYLQFDIHPEKTVFGQSGISGIKFFFWDSQFGRFFNSGPIKGKGDISFFIHTTLWAFLPWSLPLYFGIIKSLIKIKSSIVKPIHILYGSSLITFLLFSFSSFQLPHYILILFPHFSIFTANHIVESKHVSRWITLQKVILGISVLLLIFIAYFFEWKWFFIIIATGLGLIGLFNPIKNPLYRFIFTNAMQAATVGIFLYLFFYPNLLKFQSGEQAGRWHQKYFPRSSAYFYKTYSYTYDFYAPGMPQNLENIQNLKSEDCVYTTEEGLNELRLQSNLKILGEYQDFHITKLTKDFIHPNTRLSVCEKRYLVQIKR